MSNTNNLSNLPPTPPSSQGSPDSVVQTFNAFYQYPIQLDAGTLSAMLGFFENKGFDKVSAQSISVILMTQALQEKINPMTLLDGLSGFDGIQLTTLATEILNYNRYNSSYLGIATPIAPFLQVQRNVIA